MKSKDDDKKEEEKVPTDASYDNTARDMTEPGDDDSDDTIEIKVGHQTIRSIFIIPVTPPFPP